MFVGREDELNALERMYEKSDFQMAVIYGRRRVGKTSLIDEFVRGKRTLYFTAQQKTSRQNLELFSASVYEAFSLPSGLPAFTSWNAAFAFVIDKAKESESDSPLVFVFDEFPYAAQTEPSLPSVLQTAIDHGFKQTRTRIILCGSNEGFMESEVLGSKSPLYGRRTMQIHLMPFDYLDAARMLPNAKPEELVAYYATFGGTPYYLSQLDTTKSYEDNVSDLLFDRLGMLCEEPLMLLRQELNEPSSYNSVLDAIGSGATASTRIAEKAGVNPNSVGKYLKTLESLGIVEKSSPLGGGTSSKRSIWRLKDPFFSYWYRFVSAYLGTVEEGMGCAVVPYATTGQVFDTYIGKQFETICLQWVLRQARADRLPFPPLEFGQWWGTDPKAREEVDIDVVAVNKIERELLVGECKWRNELDESEAIKTLEERSDLLSGFTRKHFILFTKETASSGTKAKAKKRGDLLLVSAKDLYAELGR